MLRCLELPQALVDRLHLLRRDTVPVSRVDPDVIEASHTAEVSKEGRDGFDIRETNSLSMALQPLGPESDGVCAEKLRGVSECP